MGISEDFARVAFDAAAQEVGDAVLRMHDEGVLISRENIIERLSTLHGESDDEDDKVILDLAMTMLKAEGEHGHGVKLN